MFLSAWFFLIFAFSILTNFIAARFLLLLLPPLFLLIYNELSSRNLGTVKSKIKFTPLEISPTQRGIAKFLMGFIILISIIFSTILAIGDYQFAGLYRHFLYSLKKKTPLKEKGMICLRRGHYYNSWGYGYYLEKFHFVNMDYEIKKRLNQQYSIFITPTEPVLPLVTEKKFAFREWEDLDYDRILLDSIYYRGNVVLHNRKFHAGFYCHDWGLLPFYLSMRKVPLECFKIYRLSYSPKDGF